MSMSTGSGGGGTLTEINVTPLVDVMLVLLIIFMVTAPMLQTGVDVNLPEAKAQTIPDDEGKLILTVTKDKRVFLGQAADPLGRRREGPEEQRQAERRPRAVPARRPGAQLTATWSR